jgi:hypothetical protein
MIPSQAAIQREMELYPDICLGRENIAINRIRQRGAILGYCRDLRSLERSVAEHKAGLDRVGQRLRLVSDRLKGGEA